MTSLTAAGQTQAQPASEALGTLPTGSFAANKIHLGEAYPNPTSATVSFSYFLPVDSPSALLVLRNTLGPRVAVQPLPHSGTGEVSLSVLSLPTGLYTGTVEIAGQELSRRKLTIVR